MTNPSANRYSHTPRGVFDKAIDKLEVKRARLHGLVRDNRSRLTQLEDELALMRATLTAIHERLFKE